MTDQPNAADGPASAGSVATYLQVAVVAFALVVIGLIWGLYANDSWRARDLAYDNARTHLGNLTLTFAEHTARTIESLDDVAKFVRAGYLAEGADADLAAVQRLLLQQSDLAKLINFITVADEHGDIIWSTAPSTTTNIRDRKHFSIQRDGRDDRLYISEPVLGRRSGKWSVPLTRRIVGPDGSFRGVVVVAVDPFYFGNLYGAIDLGPGGVVSLVGVDGVIRVRRAGADATIGESVAQGAHFPALAGPPRGRFSSTSPVDGVARYYSYSTVPNYPLIVLVGQTDAQIMVDVDARSRSQLTVTLIATAGIALLGLILLNLVRQMGRADKKLLDSAQTATRLRREAESWRERITQAFETISEGFALYDSADRLVLWNRKYAEFYGVSKPFLVFGATFEEIVRRGVAAGQYAVPAGREEAWIAERVARHRDPSDPIEQQLADGTWLQINERRTASGEIVGIRTDITALKRREAELRDLARRNKTQASAIEALSIGVTITDPRLPDNPIVFVNSAFTRLHGYAPEEVIGRNPRILCSPATPPEAVQAIREAVREERPIAVELQNRRADGTDFWTLLTISPVHDEAGALINFVGIQTDISAQHEAALRLEKSEEKFRKLVDISSDWYWEQDSSLRFTYMAPSVLLHTGMDPSHAIGRTRREMPILDVSAEQWAKQDADVAARRPFSDFRFSQIDANGRKHRLTVTGRPYFDENRTFLGYYGTGRDVTDLIEAQEQLRGAKERAEQADRAKSTFLATMSHEIRTPMNAILGIAELLLDTRLGAKQTDYAQTIRDSGTALLAIINDILDISKMEAGQLQLNPAPFDVADTVVSTLQLLEFRALQKGLKLQVTIEPSARCRVLGDGVRVKQVLWNLVGNAVKFTDRGVVRVLVSGADAPVGHLELRFEVRDTGGGIAPEDVSRLFARFSQVDSSLTRRAGGTGLGLSICKQLVELMGGRIDVASRRGEGTRFWFTLCLPLAQPVGLPDPPAIVRRSVARPARVLVVDDSETNRLVAGEMLKKAGHSVEMAEDGQSAIDAAARSDYDVIFMDVSMPGLDGLEATRAIRARGGRAARIPIVALTAHAMSGDRERCLAAGMSDYVTKPLRGAELAMAVERVLARGDDPAVPPTVPDTARRADADVDPHALRVLEEGLDRETAERLIGIFCREVPGRIARIRAAAARCDDKILHAEAHALKSSAATFGARRLSELAADIEGGEIAPERLLDLAGAAERALAWLEGVYA